MLVGELALTSAAFFAGAAFYVNMAEHPARMALNDRALLVIRPTNQELLNTDPAHAGARSRALLERWGRLHAGRTALGAAATILFLWASLASRA